MEVNRTATLLTGYSQNELTRLNVLSLIPEPFKTDAREHFNRVLTKDRASGNFPFIIKNGERRLVNIEAVKISEERMMGFLQDITEKTREQKRVNILGKIFDRTVNEIYLFDVTNLKFTEANAAALNNTLYTMKELKEMTFNQLSKKHTFKSFMELTKPLLNRSRDQVRTEAIHFRKDGSSYEAEVQIQLLETDEEKLFSAVVLDITDRKQAEKELVNLKTSLENQVKEKTEELKNRISELEIFREATIEREHRMEEMRKQIERLRKKE